jgi:ribonuclease BN (tRNA processing enzyme)
VARIARDAGVGRAVLTHIYQPTYALDLEREVGKGFDGVVVVAEDGTKLTV